MTNINTRLEAVDLLEEKLTGFHITPEESPISMFFPYDHNKAFRSAFLEDQRFSSELACKKTAKDIVSRAYKKAEELYDRAMDNMLLDFEEKLIDAISELEGLLESYRSPENAETIVQISELLNVSSVLQAVEEVQAERKASASLEPLQTYLDQIQYEENRLAETCEDNPLLKQLGKLFRYYGFQASSAIVQLQTDSFSMCFAVRTTFALQANAYVADMMVCPILELLPRLREGLCEETEEDTLEEDDDSAEQAE